MERRNTFVCRQALPHAVGEYLYGAIASRFPLALMLVLSCCTSSAQPTDDPQAQYKRGIDYWYGEKVAQDYVEAANSFRKAAEGGHAESQYRLAQMLAIGQG